MKRSKKILLIIAVVFSLAVYSCVSVAGASSTKDGLQISMTTDKESYTVNEAVNVNITVKNTNNYAVKNISIESIVPSGLTLKKGHTTKTIESLQANEELKLQFTAMLEKDSQTTTNPPPSNSNVKSNTDEQTKNNTTDNSGSLKTGENNATLHFFGILFFISALLILYLVLIHKKKRTNKKTRGIISFVLCLTILGSSVTGLNLFSAKATETTENGKSIEVSKVITVDGHEFTISATVSYEAEEQEATTPTEPESNDIQLTIDQKDFTTTDSLQTITGSFKAPSDVLSIKYTVEVMEYTNKENFLEIFEAGEAKIIDDKWIIENLRLSLEKNIITVTLTTVDNKSITKKLNITYDSGYDYNYSNSDILVDQKSGIKFFNNIILIFFKPNVSEIKKQEIVESIDGKVVGRTNGVFLFQVKIKKVSTLAELNIICKNLLLFNEVAHASYDAITETDTNSVIPSDTWEDSNGWDEDVPNGSNWWCEAVKLPSAWSYNDRFNKIMIGVADNGFDTTHEDLIIRFPNKHESENNALSVVETYHGTHVAGIIGATSNNDIGITGVIWNNPLYGFDIEPTLRNQLFKGETTYKRIIDSISTLVQKGVKIINYSIRDNEKDKKGNAYNCSVAMANLLFQNYDFVFVFAAGNDGFEPGLFSSIKSDNCYTVPGKVTYQDIKSRIIIVASAEIDGLGYRISDFSNVGNNIDIAAPGTNIYSTVIGGYQYKSGTSMAAPIVTGIAGLVWSVNNNFTGAEVKEIVCNSVNKYDFLKENPNNPSYVPKSLYLVNAKLAVETALIKTDGYLKNDCTIKFVDSDTQLAIPAKCTIYKATDEDISIFEKYRYIDYCETFNIELPNGIYRIDVTPLDENHQETSVTFTQDNSGINTQVISINKKEVQPDESDFIYIIENNEGIITGYKGNGGDVLIPAFIEDKPVVKIDEHTFSKNKTITSVEFAGSIRTIGNWAFSNCTSLQTVTIHGEVTNIENYAFDNCSKLSSFIAYDGVINIGVGSFSSCKKLTDFGIQSKIQSIDNMAFFSCKSLTDFDYPKTANVNKYAFMGTNTKYKDDWIKF